MEKKIGDVEDNTPDISGLLGTAVLNTKISEAEIRIPVVSGLVKKRVYNTIIKDIKEKYMTTADYNKFTGDIVDAKIKQKNMSQHI